MILVLLVPKKVIFMQIVSNWNSARIPKSTGKEQLFCMAYIVRTRLQNNYLIWVKKKQSFDLNERQLFGLLREKNEISYFLGCQIDIVHVFMTPYIKSKIKRKLQTQRKLQKSNKNSKYQTKLLLCKNQMFLFI